MNVACNNAFYSELSYLNTTKLSGLKYARSMIYEGNMVSLVKIGKIFQTMGTAKQ